MRTQIHDKVTPKEAQKLLRSAALRFCDDRHELGQGDYCGACNAYIGRGDQHKTNCLYVRITRYLKAAKERDKQDGCSFKSL